MKGPDFVADCFHPSEMQSFRGGGVFASAASMLLALATPAFAGPPYLSDDPAPTPLHQYEIYAFANGVDTHDVVDGAFGIDFNYGATPDLQLTATFPIAYE